MFLIDSGADANVIAERDWEALAEGKAEFLELDKNPKAKLIGYAAKSGLEIVCSFKAWVEVCDAVKPRTLTEFFVVRGGTKSLLGRKASMSMRLLEVGLLVNAVETEAAEFPSIPGVTVEFDIDKSVKPVCQTYVSIPAHFWVPSIVRIKKMAETKIIERVFVAPRWISGLSAVPKGKGDFRLVVNMRGPNRAIRRQYYRMPRLDEMKTKLYGARWFTKLDLSSAFHHLKLSEEAKEMTTFMAPDGMYRFTRLVFGVNCAPEIFQREMEKILGNMEGVLVYIDDVLIFAKDPETLEQTTEAVLRKLKANNLSLNTEKCEYRKESLTFLGHRVSASGMNIDEVKVEDVKNFREPQNGSELKSFLGLVNYVRDFIPNFSDLTAPLRDVDGMGKFKWGTAQAQAFEDVKKEIVQCTVTQGYFNLEDDTELYTDASGVAIGAVLVQTDKSGGQRIISFASKSLTSAERNYPQPHREALAIVWGVEHFHYYLLGAKFVIKTDAEGVKFIFDKSATKAKRFLQRAERWAMRLAEYDYTIVAIKGADNIADPPSRLCETRTDPEPFEEPEMPGEVARLEINLLEDIQFTADHMPILEVKMATEGCDELKRVRRCLETKKWGQDLAIYATVADRLEVVDGLVLNNGLIVVPKALRAKALAIAHQGHLGMSKTKSILKERVWWPHMYRAVDDWVAACRACVLKGRNHPPPPMMRTILPEGPWDYLAIDYCGPFASLGDIHFVGLVDYYSRFIVIAPAKSTGWKHLEPILTELFERFGNPLMVKSDNGPPFSGDAYKTFLQQRGIEPTFSWPLNPQQNGAAEATMKHINDAIQSGAVEGAGAMEAIRKRVRAHNSAVHRETHQIPDEVMYGRRLRRGLPLARDTKVTIDDQEMRQRDWDSKQKRKESEDRRRRAKDPDVEVGDKVFLERGAKRKGETNFDPTEMVVVARSGGDLTMRAPDGQEVRRDITKAKKVPTNESVGVPPASRVVDVGNEENPANPPTGTDLSAPGAAEPRPQRTRTMPRKFGDFIMQASTAFDKNNINLIKFLSSDTESAE